MNKPSMQVADHAVDAEFDSTSPASLPTASTFEPVSIAYRAAGWTPDRQRQFIEELADCGIVREAAARVGMTEQSAYRVRRRPDAAGFNRAWDAAVQLGVDRLQSTAFERAIAGTVRRRYFHGEVVGEERVFDNRLLIYLLGRLDKKRDYHVGCTIDDWKGSMGAVEDGLDRPLPEPGEGRRTPVWRDQAGEWVTNFAPPEGFSDDEWSYFGEEDYYRRLSPGELEAVEAWQYRLTAQNGLRREHYFSRLKREFQSTSAEHF